MRLPDLKLSRTYSSEESNLLEDFYLPALGVTVEYDRAVGYFSASMLSFAATALGGLIRAGGRMRLLIGDPLDEEEFIAVKRGAELKEFYQRFDIRLQNIIESADDPLTKHHLELLSWLIAADRLEIRIALVPRGMYHEKIGIMRDAEQNTVVFQGSANETRFALLPDLNYESIAIYPSWDRDVFSVYAEPLVARFARLWTGHARNVMTVAIPSESYERLRAHYPKQEPPQAREAELSRAYLAGNTFAQPSLPGSLQGRRYELMAHQRDALNQWKAQSWRGIMALATGSGKTVTALHGATILAQANIKQKNAFALVVAVPYQVLADQWAEVMLAFGMRPIKCYRSRSQWEQELRDEIASLLLSREGAFLSIVVVNATLQTDTFRQLIGKLDSRQTMFVGDECHHHASSSVVDRLPGAHIRMGLSATPWNARDTQRRSYLTDYYGQVAARYTIRDALTHGVLTPYDYHVSVCTLSPSEEDAYEEQSQKIAKLIAIREQGGSINETDLNRLMSERARVVGSAASKFEALRAVIAPLSPTTHSLFYCGDGSSEQPGSDVGTEAETLRDVERVALTLHATGWKTSRFTAAESHAERVRIMDNFKGGDIDAIVAIRVLDEGFDMPGCKRAYLLASSRSERQFIQRRGRVLRKAPGKSAAYIHDFLVMPSLQRSSPHLSRLAEQELVRALEFSRFSRNVEAGSSAIDELCREYQVDRQTLEETVNTFEELI